MRHAESKIQQACIRWFRYAFPEYAYCLIAVPNGVATTQSQGRILKAEGMVAGAADLLLLVPQQGYGCLCMEMKTPTGRQQLTQKIWQKEIEKVGNKYVIVRSLEEFCQIVCEYLGKVNVSSVIGQRQVLKELVERDNTSEKM